MKILIMGGTQFVGRHIAAAALAAGHDVTLFHRGKTGADLFPSATHVLGDRNTEADLARLGDGQWDATVDVNAYLPGQVRSLAAVLGGRGGQQLFISTASLYQTPVAPGFSEDAPLHELAEPLPTEVTLDTYGGLKVACERAAIELHGPGSAVIRPTYVIGPYDFSYRFTYWVDRIARGGEVLAPGNPADPIQVIDARDMATWAVSLLERSVPGIFHAVSPPPPFGFGDMLAAIAAQVAPPGTVLTWVGQEFLQDSGLDDNALPLWPGGDSESAINAADPARANAAGLAPRPLSQTIDEIRVAEQASPTAVPPGLGLSAEAEADLLAHWAAQSG
ncbi:MAG: NAD-dependent epimerase/dehydratase family protein [Actinomycetota bacterium]